MYLIIQEILHAWLIPFFRSRIIWGDAGEPGDEDEGVRFVLVQDLKFKPGSMLKSHTLSGKAQMFL